MVEMWGGSSETVYLRSEGAVACVLRADVAVGGEKKTNGPLVRSVRRHSHVERMSRGTFPVPCG